MFLPAKHLSRRTALKGIGATVALPLLDSMMPARRGVRADRGRPGGGPHASRLHRTGARRRGVQRVRADPELLESPAEVGRNFDLAKGSLAPLEPFRKHLTIVSNTDSRMAEASTRRRSAATTSGPAP